MAIPENQPASIRETLKIMRRLIRNGKRNPEIRKIATDIAATVPEKHFYQEIVAVYCYVKARVRYTRDTHDSEMIQPPEWVLANGHGDCDDFTVVICALLEAIGHPTRIVAVGFAPGEYSHVYAETRSGSRWIAVDASENHGVGWFPPGIEQRMEIFNGS
jgi:transglutaminase-like putative cysteine protease